MADESNLVAKFARNGREAVGVSVEIYRGAIRLDIRQMAPMTAVSDALTYTKKGVNLPFSSIGELRQALDAAEALARERGWA